MKPSSKRITSCLPYTIVALNQGYSVACLFVAALLPAAMQLEAVSNMLA